MRPRAGMRANGATDGGEMAGRLPAAPPILPGFSYVRPLGTGGFADVFLFEQDMPRRRVAVKVLLQAVVDDGVLRMFNAEADVMARLSAHPAILTIHEAGVSADGRPYLVMEYCPASMAERYRREFIPVPEVLATGVRIASALETAHRAGLLHRDVKPSNILVTAFGAPVLSDFGIATAVAGGAHDVIAMSIPWSAPEVIDESVAGTIPSEVWSLGATVYSLLAGRSPFERAQRGQNSREELKGRIRRARYTPTGRPDAPEALETVLRRSLALDPGARHPDAASFARDLQEVQRHLGLPATALEVAVEEWPESVPVDFRDDSLRGPARATVPRAAERAARPGPARPVRREDLGDVPLAEQRPGRPGALRAAAIVTATAVLAVIVVAVAVVAGGA